MNSALEKVGLALLVLAALLLFISFTLINNTVQMGVFARRFSIHTMKLVGASWNFIRWPYIRQAIALGLISGIIAIVVLAGGGYFLFLYEPDVYHVITWQVMLFTAVAIMVFGLFITIFCSWLSVNKFLKMKQLFFYFSVTSYQKVIIQWINVIMLSTGSISSCSQQAWLWSSSDLS